MAQYDGYEDVNGVRTVGDRGYEKNAGITRDEWLEALGEAARPEVDPMALTIDELATLLKLKRAAARRRAERMVDEGKAIEVTKQVAVRNSTELRRVRAFRLITGKNKQK